MSLLILASLALACREPGFTKIVIDKRFVSESVAIGDVNRDGKMDILAGNLWYEAPKWTPHEIAPYVPVDPARGYSNCFNSWAYDVNGDGWVDQIVIGMPGEKAVWRENPKGGKEPWREHPLWRSACNESPLFADLFRNGKPVLVMGYDDRYVAWFSPDSAGEWQPHNVSEANGSGSGRYSHGLGLGDLNRDGHNEILTKDGYYAGPPWKFVKSDLGADCAQMYVYDVNRDGLPDVLSSSSHDRGLWWFEQRKDGGFTKHVIDDSISQTHSLVMADLNKDGKVDLVTGKRVWAHGPTGDVGANEPALLVWYELRPGPTWTRHVIDEDSGVGTQFEVRDMNRDGRPDIVVANKKGVFLFSELRR